MTQNNTKLYRNIKLKLATIELLNKLKVHPRQSYDEVIRKILLKGDIND